MNALLVLNGDIVDYNLLRSLGDESDFILIADGGMRHSIKASLIPDLVIGDLDSISEEGLHYILENNISVKKFPVKKDETDSELSIEYLIKKGAKDVTVIGAIGTRIDHSLANIYLLNRLNEKGIKGKIIDKNNTIFLVDNELILKKKKSRFISIIPIHLTGAVVTMRGFEYELEKARIDFGTTKGISNRIIESSGYIKVHEGNLLVFQSCD